MLILDLHTIGSKLYAIRKARGLTQAEVAEKAEISDRTYADIERGTVNMRIDSLLKICAALRITPNDILTIQDTSQISEKDIVDSIKNCSPSEKETALALLKIYIDSLA
ncbi:MAG: helix-turn-helix transcriptional regulator [Clostridia bacterium]|nr:helix-turn-helix transcriptional regulator [Clostridia bacterium]